MTRCDGLRSDGAQCEDELGHFGGHIWPEVKRPIVVVGDEMRISVELLRQIDQEPDHCSVLVRLRDVRHEADGSKTLVLEKVYT